MNEPIAKGWHSRGYLPHFDGVQVTQFVTFRLADALPAHVITGWQQELARLKLPEQEHHLELQKRIERYLDQGLGACHLQQLQVAAVIEQACLFNDGKRYDLSAWVVMPNHVHLLFTPHADESLSDILQTLKSFTAHQANKLLKRNGTFWMADYFDRYIRDARHYATVVRYIEQNPVKAGLCRLPEDWRYSSAWWRARLLGNE